MATKSLQNAVNVVYFLFINLINRFKKKSQISYFRFQMQYFKMLTKSISTDFVD